MTISAKTLSLYDVSIPASKRALGIMDGLLAKARAFADDNGLDHAALLEARLADDMKPLIAQVQFASDTAKFIAVRVAQVPPVAMPDSETSFDELHARIAATVAILDGVPTDAMDGRDDAQVQLKTPNGTLEFTARDYVLGFALPNLYVHVTTAYAILRHKGVAIGKMDYLGAR